jgi:uncharacterized membrane protein
MVALEQRQKVRMTGSEHLADLITAAAGSMTFVWLNMAWYAFWIGGHTIGLLRFDPYPFSLLTMIVSLEAIGLAIFVLISQNRQAVLADKRAKLDLQINLIAEEEVTKVLEIVARLEERLGTGNGHDPEVARMTERTRVRKVAEEMERLEEQIDKRSVRGPSSAVDTES